MIQQNLNTLLSIIFSSLAIFCLTIPEKLIASFSLLQTKKTESFSEILQSLIKLVIAFSEKNFAIGPLPIILLFDFSKFIYASPLAPSLIAQLFNPSKKLLGFEIVFGTGIAFTIPPLILFL